MSLFSGFFDWFGSGNSKPASNNLNQPGPNPYGGQTGFTPYYGSPFDPSSYGKVSNYGNNAGNKNFSPTKINI
jgi:hypothetical protein